MQQKIKYTSLCAAIVSIGVLWLFTSLSCAVFSKTLESDAVTPLRDTLLTYPENSKPVFIGFSPRLQEREGERTVAVKNAAVQAARYLTLTGGFSAETVTRGGFSVLNTEVTIDDDINLAERIADELVVTDTAVTAEGTLVRCIYPDAGIIELKGYHPRVPPGTPNWLEKTPSIDNHLVGVGTAGRKRLLSDSFAHADKAALADILSQVSVTVHTESDQARFSGYGTMILDRGRITAAGELTGFYVLDRWVSEDGKWYYSLAICPKIPLWRDNGHE